MYSQWDSDHAGLSSVGGHLSCQLSGGLPGGGGRGHHLLPGGEQEGEAQSHPPSGEDKDGGCCL